jgi:hypothetical protein
VRGPPAACRRRRQPLPPPRLNPDLGDFVSTIYSRAFKPQKAQTRHLATRLGSLGTEDVRGHGALQDVANAARFFLVHLSRAMLREGQLRLRPPLSTAAVASVGSPTAPQAPLPISLALISLKARTARRAQLGYETHVRGEAALAAGLVHWLRKSCPEDDIFVATPHRIQRHAVREALRSMSTSGNDVDALTQGIANLAVGEVGASPVTVDTVERLQGGFFLESIFTYQSSRGLPGSEAAFVICLFSDTFAANSSSSTTLDFLLERRRLNVAISRAKTLCILITSREVLRPSVHILANEETAKGYMFLRSFEDRAWRGEVEVDLDSFHSTT